MITEVHSLNQIQNIINNSNWQELPPILTLDPLVFIYLWTAKVDPVYFSLASISARKRGDEFMGRLMHRLLEASRDSEGAAYIHIFRATHQAAINLAQRHGYAFNSKDEEKGLTIFTKTYQSS